MFTYRVIYVDVNGRQRVVECDQSPNIALGIAKVRLREGAKSAVVEVTYKPEQAA